MSSKKQDVVCLNIADGNTTGGARAFILEYKISTGKSTIVTADSISDLMVAIRIALDCTILLPDMKPSVPPCPMPDGSLSS